MQRTIVLHETLCNLCFRQDGREDPLYEGDYIELSLPINGVVKSLTLCKEHAEARYTLTAVFDVFSEYGESEGPYDPRPSPARRAKPQAQRDPQTRTGALVCPIDGCGSRYQVTRQRYFWNHIVAHRNPGRMLCGFEGCQGNVPGHGYDQEAALGMHLRSVHGVIGQQNPTPAAELRRTMAEVREQALQVLLASEGQDAVEEVKRLAALGDDEEQGQRELVATK